MYESRPFNECIDMISICNACVYASKCMRYCGKGLPTKVSECNGYVKGESAAPRWTIQPGCQFPVTSSNYRGGIQEVCVITIDSYNPLLTYLIHGNQWLTFSYIRGGLLGGMWRIYLNHHPHSGNRVMLIGSSIIHRPKVPSSLWWLDPTLISEDCILMYALLVAVCKCTPTTQISKGYRRVHSDRHKLLTEALDMGTQCKGAPLRDWALAIKQGPAPHCIGDAWGAKYHWMTKLLGRSSTHESLWGEVMYQEWVSGMDALDILLGRQ